MRGNKKGNPHDLLLLPHEERFERGWSSAQNGVMAQPPVRRAPEKEARCEKQKRQPLRIAFFGGLLPKAKRRRNPTEVKNEGGLLP